MRPLLRSRSIALALLGAALPVVATAADPTRLDEMVVIATRRAQPREDVAGSVSAIGRGEIERLQAQDLRDVVRDEPGVAFVSDPGRFGLDGFSIRGLQGNRVAVEVDGVPMPAGFAVGSFSNAGRDQLAPELIGRMEILRGPASALYGSDALGGIVAIRTLAPADLLRGPGAYLGSRLGYSGADQGRRAGVLGAWQSEQAGALLSLQQRRGHETENRPLPGGLAANPAETDTQSALTKLQRDLGPVRFGLTLEHYAGERDTEVRSLVGGPGQYATTEALTGFDVERRQRAVVDVDWSAPLAGVDALTLKLYGQHSAVRQDTRQQRRAAPPAARFPTLRERRFALDQAQLGLELQAQGQWQTDALDAGWSFGIEAMRNEVREWRDGLETNLSTGATTNVILGERLPVRDFPDSRLDSLGAWLGAEVRLGDGDWSLLPALRYDRSRVDAAADALWREDYPNRPVVDVDASQLTPRLGLRYAPTASDRVYLAWTEGFRAPPFSDVNIALTLSGFNYVVLSNPDLQPERSRGFELGWNHDAPMGWWRVAAFHNAYRDLIESRVNLGVNADGATVFQSVNRARARVHGFEAAGALKLDGLSPRLHGYTLHAAAALTRGSDTVREQPLNTVQPDRLVLGLGREAQGLWPAWRLTGRFTAAMRRVDRSSADLYAPPGSAVYDLSLRQPLGNGFVLDATLHNLGNRRYWDWAALRGVLNAGTPAPDFYTAPGRHLVLTLSAGW